MWQIGFFILLIQFLILTVLALILRHNLLHDLHNRHVIKCLRSRQQTFLVHLRRVVIILTHLRHHDLRVMRRLRVLLRRQQLLIQLLARTQTAELDLHVLSTRQLDHPLRQIHNLHRTAHVEHKDLTALAHRTGLQHQTASLRNQHEVTDDIRVRHRDRLALLNLLLEDRNHRTVAAQHITETRRDKLRAALHLTFHNRLVQALAVNLTDTLRAAHHIRGVHRLVRRNHHKLLRAILHRQVRNHPRTVDIVLHRNRRIILHHRHMLIRCRMEHIVRTVLRKDTLHVRLVCNTRHNRPVLDLRKLLRHHQPDVMHRRLRLVNQHHLRRFEARHLTHHLTTDTARSTRNQDLLAFQQHPDGIHIHLNLVTRQQVLNLHLVQMARRQVRLPVPRLRRRHHHDVDTCRDELIHHRRILPEQLTLQRRHQQRIHAQHLHLRRNARTIEIHLLPHQHGILHLLPVTDECFQTILLRLRSKQTVRQRDTPRLCTVDSHRRSLIHAETVEQTLHKYPFHPHQEGRDGEESQYPARTEQQHLRHIRQQQRRQQRQGRADERSTRHPLQIHERRIAHDTRIRTESTEPEAK